MNFIEIYQKYVDSIKRVGKNYFTLCPFHIENNPSFSINPETGWFHCFGCGAKGNIFQFLRAMKEQGRIDEEDEKLIQKSPSEIQKELKDKAQHNTELGKNYRKLQQKTFDEKKSELLKDGYSFVSEYIYYSLNGVEEYRVYRFERPKGDGTYEKEIFPVVGNIVGMQGKKQIPYGLHQFMLASPDSEIWICEGEKCADALIAAMPSSADLIVLGYRKASDFKTIPIEELFFQKEITIFEDNDETGSRNTREITENLKPIAKKIKVVKFADFSEKFDVADYLLEKDWNSLLKLIEIAAETIETPISQVNIIKTGTIEKPEKQEEWIMEPFIPTNSIVLLDGLGGIGKSIFAMEMAFAISTGQSFLLHDITPTGKYPILYITAEETDWRFWQRLKNIENAYNVKTENFYWLSTISKDFCLSTTRLFCKKQNVQPTETFVFLENAIQKTKAKLVVLDSWINFYGLDENSTEDGIYAYDCLKGLIRKYDCSFILIHHQTKDAMKSLSPLFRGTMVFREQSRTRIVMCKKHGQKIVEIEKSNYYSDLLEVFPVSIELSNGVWTVTGQKVVVEEEEIGKKNNRNGNRKNNRSEEIIYQDPDYFA